MEYCLHSDRMQMYAIGKFWERLKLLLNAHYGINFFITENLCETQ